MKKRLAFTLSVALGLTLLAGCSTEGSIPSPINSPTPSPTASALPTPQPDTSATPAPSPQPSEILTPPPIEEPSPSPTPSPTPSETANPSELPALKPSPTPDAPAPSESTQPALSAVKSIWNEVSLQSRPALMDMDAPLLSDFYGIDAADLEEFVAKMPAMSASISEFLIAKCAPGRVDAVKQACLNRQADLVADDRYPETVKLAENYKLVTQGDYLLFAIDQHASDMVSIFNAYTK